jgi:hypothetical protein
MYNTEIPNPNELPSNQQLLRSTIIALIVAAVLLVTTVLPAEYGIDPTRIGRALGLTQMGEIKVQLAEEVAQHNAAQQANAAAVVAPTPEKSDTTTVTLKPNEGVEYKLEMSKGAKAKYEWVSVGGPVNHNLHTDGQGGSHSYSKGTGVEKDSGEFTAVSDGYHGWFWRNRNSTDVTITLKTSGDYKSIKKM